MNEINDQIPEQSNENYHEYGLDNIVLEKLAKDMEFSSIFLIVAGAITCLGIITAIIGVPYIIMGLRGRDAAKELRYYLVENNKRAIGLSFKNLGSLFRNMKILIIIQLVFIALYIIFISVFLSLGISSGILDSMGNV